MITKAWAWRAAMIGAAAFLIPACSDTTSGFLLNEQFNGTFPGTAWTLAGSAAAVKDLSIGTGSPPKPPSLRMSSVAAPDSVTATSTTLLNADAVTVAVSIAADTTLGTDVGTGSIVIKDSFATVIGSATWNAATGGLLTFKIDGVTDFSIAAPAPDLAFHRLVFRLTGGGNASWTLDNGVPLHTANGLTPFLPLTLELGATYPAGTGFALFYFDNVNVTSP